MIVGIDPGIEGAYALLRGAKGNEALRLPYTGNRIDVARLVGAFPPVSDVRLVVFEEIGYRRRQGVQSIATRAMNAGKILGALESHGYSIVIVPPQRWQKTVLGDVETGESKAASIAFVQRTYPGIDLYPGRCTTPQDGLADAVCLAEYGRMLLGL